MTLRGVWAVPPLLALLASPAAPGVPGSPQEVLAAVSVPEPAALPRLLPEPQEVLLKRLLAGKGSVCGDRAIRGRPAGDIAGSRPGCGIRDAVRVQEIAGVRLSRESLMTCRTAKALKTWVKRRVIKGFGRRNKVVSMQVAAHYACRTRNNRPGAKLSEHGRGQAIDISAFTLEDGQTITVLEGWQKRRTRKRLKKIWKAACGPFGTVLGPEADRYHRDHFHLDVARHRRGPYCR